MPEAAWPTVLLPVDQAEELFSADAGEPAEAFLTLLGEAAMEACLEECSGERDFVDFFAYPATDFLRMVRRASLLMQERGWGSEETLRMLGHRDADGPPTAVR